MTRQSLQQFTGPAGLLWPQAPAQIRKAAVSSLPGQVLMRATMIDPGCHLRKGGGGAIINNTKYRHFYQLSLFRKEAASCNEKKEAASASPFFLIRRADTTARRARATRQLATNVTSAIPFRHLSPPWRIVALRSPGRCRSDMRDQRVG